MLKYLTTAMMMLPSIVFADTFVQSQSTEIYGSKVLSKLWNWNSIEVRTVNIGDEFIDFCNGKADAVLSFRKIKNCSIKYQEYVLGYDTITLSATYRNDYVKPFILTKEQIGEILSKNITWWDEVDSSLPHKVIEIYATHFFQNALKDVFDNVNENSLIPMPNDLPYIISKITLTQDAIGVFSISDTMANLDKIRPIVVDQPPSINSVNNKKYTLMRPLTLYVSSNFKYNGVVESFKNADFGLMK